VRGELRELCGDGGVVFLERFDSSGLFRLSFWFGGTVGIFSKP
jgi:hypothetical protein